MCHGPTTRGWKCLRGGWARKQKDRESAGNAVEGCFYRISAVPDRNTTLILHTACIWDVLEQCRRRVSVEIEIK